MWIFTKKSFYYQFAEFCYHDKFWVEALAWRESGCNKLTKMSCKLWFYYILLMKTFSRRSFCWEIFYLIELYILECRGVTNGGPGGPCPPSPPLQIPNQTRSNSFRFKHQEYYIRCSEIIRTRNFTIFTIYATIFG